MAVTGNTVEMADLDRFESSTDVDKEMEATFEQKPVYSDWNQWQFDNVDPKVKRIFKACVAFLLIFLIIILPIIFSACSTTVEFEYNAVVINSRGSIEDDPVGPGRIFRAAGFRIQRFPRFDKSVEYTAINNNPITARVQDGQIISLDLSWQYHLNKSNLVAIYRQHKGGFEQTLSQVVFSTLRDVAAGYTSDAFFENRTHIEKELRASIEEEARQRGATVTGFQVRAIDLPSQLDQRLIEIQMRGEDARAGTARLQLEKIRAVSAAEILQSQTARKKLKTQLTQETVVAIASINQTRDRIYEETNQLLTRVQESSKRNLTLYQKETELLLTEYEMNTTLAIEQTRAKVNAVNTSLATNVSIYEQETSNLRLAYEADIALIEQRSRRNVSEILSETTREEETFNARLALEKSEIDREVALLLQDATLAVARARNEAKQRGLTGLSAEVFIAEEAAAALLGQIRYMDVATPDQLKLSTIL